MMDRRYKAYDKVHVYQDDKSGDLIAVFKQRPYSSVGYENYIYKGKMYSGFTDLTKKDHPTYILLSMPLEELIKE